MKKILFIVVFSLLISGLAAQEEDFKRFNFRFGLGSSFLGSGDMITMSMENELNYKLNQRLTTSLNVAYGKAEQGVYLSSSYLQGNLNLLWSPLKNTGNHTFKVGTGFSFMNVSDFYEASDEWFFGYVDTGNYGFSRRYSFGYNLILQYDYMLNPKYLIGLKLFTQNYFNGDISTGAFLRFGIVL